MLTESTLSSLPVPAFTSEVISTLIVSAAFDVRYFACPVGALSDISKLISPPIKFCPFLPKEPALTMLTLSKAPVVALRVKLNVGCLLIFVLLLLPLAKLIPAEVNVLANKDDVTGLIRTSSKI